MRQLVPLLALALVSAGCIGFGGDDANDSDENNTTDPFGNGSDFDDNGSGGNGTDDGSGFTYEERTGSAGGASVGPISEGGAEESISVANGTQEMQLNITTDDGELNVALSAPSCEDASCEETTSTESGNATVSIPAPEAGEWTVTLTSATPGMSVDYTLQIGLLVGEVEDDATAPR